jgi:hypothetical protein
VSEMPLAQIEKYKVTKVWTIAILRDATRPILLMPRG